MSDTNQQPTEKPVPAAVPPVPTAPKQEAKTFTQRFQELERSVMQNQFVINFHNQIVQNLMQQLQLVNADVATLKETLNAMLKLADDGKLANSVNTVNKMTEVNANNHRQAVQKEVDAGNLQVIDSVVDDSSIVTFSSDDVVFGYNLVAAFPDEDTKKQIVGAKIGDKVGPYTILGVYAEVVKPAPGAPDDQAPQTPDQTKQ